MRKISVLILCTAIFTACTDDKSQVKVESKDQCTATVISAGKPVDFSVPEKRWESWQQKEFTKARLVHKTQELTVDQKQASQTHALQQALIDSMYLALASEKGSVATDHELSQELTRQKKDVFADDQKLMDFVLQTQGYSPESYQDHVKAQLARKSLGLEEAEHEKLLDTVEASCKDDLSWKVPVSDKAK